MVKSLRTASWQSLGSFVTRPRVAALLIALLTAPAAGAQTLRPAAIMDEAGTPRLIRLAANNPAPTQASGDAKQVLRRELQLGPDDELRPLRIETDELGFVHERFQQYYRGVKVEHAQYSAHRRGARIETLSGEVKRPGGVSVQPTLSEATALQRALASVGARRYMWQDAAEEAGLKRQQKNPGATYFPQGELVLVEDFRSTAAVRPLVLTWKFNIYAQQPLSRAWIYVDARTGQVVLSDAIIKHATATGTFATEYNGIKTGTTDSFAGGFRLRDAVRGAGIQTFNCQGGNVYGTAVDFVDNDNNWTAAEFDNAAYDNVGLDAHYGAQTVYDYWLTQHGRLSYDNNNSGIVNYVHYDDVPGGAGYENAFWNGAGMTYGDGATSFRPLVSLDVCAHEIGHAVCEYTANLIYRNQSGALNEGFSDIWGAAIEYYSDPAKQTWLIGEDITKLSPALRSMSNPNSRGQPDTYLGTLWYTGTGDNGGVHYNSGVLNYWFYLLSVGGTGTNDIGNAFSVTGITIQQAARVAYRAERLYLSSSATYTTARGATLQAAEDLFGTPSTQFTAVANAWYAVGLGELAPTITSLNPTSGLVGATVTITGTNFLTATSVTFNGTPCASYVIASATQLLATVPVGATTGTVTVTTPSGTATSVGAFTVTSTGAAPTITAFAPAVGQRIGGTVTITGINFTGVTSVTFNGTAAVSFTIDSPTQITATVPAGATTGALRVISPGGIATAPTTFNVTPYIASFTPTSGTVGTTVVLTGTSFTGATSVQFNGTVATSFTVNSSTQITATVPAGATTGPVSVETPSGTAISAGSFFTVTPSPTPTITSFTPITSGANVTVTITGTGFLGATVVAFNGAAAGSFTIVSATTITVVVPLNATTGFITVVTPGGTATSATVFTVTPPACQLAAAISPVNPFVCAATGGSVTLTASATGRSQVPTYAVAPITFAPVSTVGTVGVTGDDNVTVGLPIGFTFTFFGQPYTTFNLSSNGNLQFGASADGNAQYTGTIPNPTAPNNFIALAWADWNQPAGGTITYYTTGTSPNQQLVVSFVGVPFYDGGGFLNAQAILYEGSNLIDLIYTSTGPAVHRILAGVENATGTVGVALPGRNNTSWQATEVAWRLTPASTPGAVTYAWSPATGLSSTTTASVVATPLIPTTYTVTVTDALCSTTASVTVETSVPTPTTTDAARCGPGTVTLSASGAPAGGTYRWYTLVLGGTAISGATTATYTTPSLSATTTYYVSAVSSGGCESTRTAVTATINPLPNTPTTTATPASITLGQSTTLDVTNPQAGVTYVWTGSGLPVGGTAGASVVVTPPSAGTVAYVVTATTGSGCPATATQNVTVMATPSVTITSFSPGAALADATITLTGSGFTGATGVTFNGTAATSFTVVSATSITVTVPGPATTGVLAVTTPGGTAASATAFTVQQVYGLVPNQCLTSDAITSTGSGQWQMLMKDGYVVAALNDQGRVLGTVTAQFTVQQGGPVRNDGNGNEYMDRNWKLTAQNTFTGQAVLVRFYVTNQEYTTYQAANDGDASDVQAPSDLRLTQYSGLNEDCLLTNNQSGPARTRLLAPSITAPTGAQWFAAQATIADHFSEFYLAGGSVPLPVELVSFTAERANATAVAVTWRTASEKDNAGFVVERSLDGRTFTDASNYITGAGTSPEAHSYAFTDAAAPAQELYYRLRQRDTDGTTSYSAIATVRAAASAPTLELAPNPAHAAVRVLLSNPPAQTVELLDALGRVARTVPATAQTVLPLDGLPAGVYVVRCGSQTRRLVVE